MMLRSLLVMAAALGLGGCVSLKTPAPEKHFYVIEAKRPEAAAAAAGATVEKPALEVRRARISPRYEANGFVYRVGEHEYKQDFYNEFFIAPGTLVSEAASDWLRRSGLFARVGEGGSAGRSEYALEVSVAGLYGDYSAATPRAVVELQFLLMRDLGSSFAPVAQVDVRKEVDLKAKSAEGLVEGWNGALAAALGELEARVGAAIAAQAAAP